MFFLRSKNAIYIYKYRLNSSIYTWVEIFTVWNGENQNTNQFFRWRKINFLRKESILNAISTETSKRQNQKKKHFFERSSSFQNFVLQTRSSSILQEWPNISENFQPFCFPLSSLTLFFQGPKSRSQRTWDPTDPATFSRERRRITARGSTSGFFVDDSFPPDNSSLIYSDKPEFEEILDKIVWRRPYEINSRARLVSDKMSPQDIQQQVFFCLTVSPKFFKKQM